MAQPTRTSQLQRRSRASSPVAVASTTDAASRTAASGVPRALRASSRRLGCEIARPLSMRLLTQAHESPTSIRPVSSPVAPAPASAPQSSASPEIHVSGATGPPPP